VPRFGPQRREAGGELHALQHALPATLGHTNIRMTSICWRDVQVGLRFDRCPPWEIFFD